MPNKFKGTCYRCGEVVEPGLGAYEKVTRVQRDKWPQMPADKKWLTQHHDCARQWRGTSQHYQFHDLRKEKA